MSWNDWNKTRIAECQCSHFMIPVYVLEAMSREDWLTGTHEDKWGDDVIPCGRARWVTHSGFCSLLWLASTDMIMMTKALPVNMAGAEWLRDSLWCNEIERWRISVTVSPELTVKLRRRRQRRVALFLNNQCICHSNAMLQISQHIWVPMTTYSHLFPATSCCLAP